MATIIETVRDGSDEAPRTKDGIVAAWLRADLARRYDLALSETLPDALLALLPKH